ncbi:hypothetical protein UPYG_G00058240 [Umbra pygmaea]|uniref:Uncharacterized protein n=1 Tax=Umbra pygmaea TaxID=75934 RepID=A0ABD0XBU9_UMBPY
MNSINYGDGGGAGKEKVCWTEKEGLWLNIVVKEEKEEEAVSINREVDAVTGRGENELVRVKEEEVTVKEEEDNVIEEEDVSEVKEGEITVTLEEESGDVMNTGERPDSHSDSRKSPSGKQHPKMPKRARRHTCSQFTDTGTSGWESPEEAQSRSKGTRGQLSSDERS